MHSLQRFQATWLAYSGLRELVLIYPVYAIMMGEHGVSPLELSTLFMVWSATTILFEVPSGTLADRFSRKRILLLSLALKGFCFPIWLNFPHYWGYLAGFVIWGLGSSLGSGTREALLHDTLAGFGASNQFVKLYGRGFAAQSMGVASALLLGGFLAESGYELPLLLSAAAPWTAAIVIAAAVKEPARTIAAGSELAADPTPLSYKQALTAGFAEARGNPALLTIIAMFASVIVIYGVLDEYIGPLLESTRDFSLPQIGSIYAMCYVARMASAALAHRLPIRTLASNARMMAVASAFLVLGLWSSSTALAFTLVTYFAISAAAEIVLQGQMQTAIRGQARATITSIAGMAQEIMGVTLYLIIGLPAELYGWIWGMTVVAVLSLLASLWFSLRARS